MEAHDQEPTPAPAPHDHTPTPRSNAILWGGLLFGVLLLVLLLTHGFGLWRARGGGGTESPPLIHQGKRIFIPESSPLRRELAVMAVTAEPRSPTVTAPGLVESNPARTVTVLPAGAGRVRALRIALGDRVKRGQVLAIIDSPDLAQAYADNDKAASASTLAGKNLGYQEAQFRIGAASQRDLDQARNDNQQAVAEYARTREHLRAMGAPEDARGPARGLTVRAPMDGAITTLSTAPGATINDDTQPIMTVADLSVVWVTAFVAEKDVAGVARNDDAEVSIDAYPARTLHGKVLFVSPVIEPDSRRNKTRIAFENPDYDLKPNMFATVTLRAPARSRVVVPAAALLMNNDRTTVFVETAPWTFERRTVEPLLQESSEVAILSGLQSGEKVVVRGGILIND
jgi:cobalt-zinc-cadmium efflux system membrane fusion protein